MKKTSLLSAAAILLGAGLSGCGGGEEAATTPEAAPEAAKSAPATPAMPTNTPMPTGISASIQEKMIEAAAAEQGIDADVEFDGDGMTMKVNDEEHGEVNVGYGSQAKLPDDLPEDLPIYEGLALSIVNQVEVEEIVTIMGTSADSIDKIGSFYKEQAAAQGWTLGNENVVPGMVHSMMYEKGDRMMQVALTPAPTGGTQVTLNSGKK